MLAELTNIPTNTLIELLFVTMMGTVALTATDMPRSNKFNAS
jgi:hypothetical protein